MDYAPTGDLSAFGPAEILAAAECSFDADLFLQALKDTGWIDESGRLHDWYDYAGKLIERREANKDRMREARAAHVQNTCEATVPNRTKQNNKKIENDLNAIGPEHRMPAKPDPETIPETRRRLAKAAKINLLQEPSVVFFDEARKAYPGGKNGLTTEWKNFDSKFRDDLEIILPLLAPAIQREMDHKAALKAAGLFVPQWKNFQTWINNRCWEQEFAKVEESNGNHRQGTGGHESAAQRNARKLRANLGLDASPGVGQAPDSELLPLMPPGAAGTGHAGH